MDVVDLIQPNFPRPAEDLTVPESDRRMVARRGGSVTVGPAALSDTIARIRAMIAAEDADHGLG